MRLALVSYVLVLAAKLVTYLLTGVMALLAEALHTLSDVFVSGFLLLAMRYAGRDRDADHMFGHARAENVAALVAATLFISFTSFNLYVEAVPRLFREEPAPYRNLGLAVGVLLGSMLLAALPLVQLVRQRERGPAARAQVAELINDQLGLAAALAGTLLLAAGIPLADPIAAIVVATIIALKAIGLFRDNSSVLLGRSPGADYLARTVATARGVPGVIDIAEIRAEVVGPDQVHAGLRVVVPASMSVRQGRQISAEIRSRVHDTGTAQYCL
ncbi:MAG TPA: cation diffusion facilitator family transporter, partial [Jiangellales bacterium]|nr:cation diffusion facilitator family transporter [Jiangellales bacterium]